MKATPEDAGCWIDGHWGRYGSARLISIAEDYGFEIDADLQKSLACHESSENDCGTDDCFCAEIVFDATDDAEAWLNENAAPKGYSFGWYDGEFFLWSTESWEETY